MKKSLIIGFTALTALIVTAGLASSSLAYQGDPLIHGPNYTAERHDIMEATFENGDYAAWKETVDLRARVTQVINETNFTKFAEAHKLAESGDTLAADKIRVELGLGQGNRGHRNGQTIGFVDLNGDGTCDNLK